MLPRLIILSLIAGGALALGGCVAGMAVSAADLAIRGAKGQPTRNGQLQPKAAEDCTAYAGHLGTVHVIDVEQRNPAKIIVWGTVDNGKQTQSFECSYGTKITGFKLRPIKARP